MNIQEAMAAWSAHAPMHAEKGAYLPGVQSYIPDEFKRDYRLAMDAQPALQTDPNSGIPVFLTTMIDPQIFKILFAPNKGAQILGEVRKGTWLDQTAMFPVVEHAGETSAYGDFNENGRTTVNTNWPTRQSFLFQVVKEYGELELERAGLGRINWVSELDASAATQLNKFSNLTYFFGVGGGLECYGLINDPNLSAALTPATKAYGGVLWVNNNAIVATANEIYLDIESLYIELVNQTAGMVERDSKMVLAMSPQSEAALTATNSFNVNVSDLLKKNFPNIRVESAVQYGVVSASNPQGVVGGNLVQLIAEELEGQKAGYMAYNEKLRSHPIIRATSSFRQKQTAGTFGCVIRMPVCFAAMQGV